MVLIYWLTHPLIGKNPQLSMKAVGDLCLDIEIYLNVLELIHATAGGEGVKILFRILNCHSKGSELLVNVTGQPLFSFFCKIPLSSGN